MTEDARITTSTIRQTVQNLHRQVMNAVGADVEIDDAFAALSEMLDAKHVQDSDTLNEARSILSRIR